MKRTTLRQRSGLVLGSLVIGVASVGAGVPSLAVEPHPAEAYGHAKLAGERLVAAAARDAAFDATIIRPRTILGHGRLGIFGILFDWIADGADVPVLGDGTNRYQFVHADDLAAVSLLAAGAAGAPLLPPFASSASIAALSPSTVICGNGKFLPFR